MLDLLPVYVILILLCWALVGICLMQAIKLILWPFRFLNRPSERKQEAA